MTLSYSVELHNTPTAAAGFLPRNTTAAVCSESFCGEIMEPPGRDCCLKHTLVLKKYYYLYIIF